MILQEERERFDADRDGWDRTAETMLAQMRFHGASSVQICAQQAQIRALEKELARVRQRVRNSLASRYIYVLTKGQELDLETSVFTLSNHVNTMRPLVLLNPSAVWNAQVRLLVPPSSRHALTSFCCRSISITNGNNTSSTTNPVPTNLSAFLLLANPSPALSLPNPPAPPNPPPHPPPANPQHPPQDPAANPRPNFSPPPK